MKRSPLDMFNRPVVHMIIFVFVFFLIYGNGPSIDEGNYSAPHDQLKGIEYVQNY